MERRWISVHEVSEYLGIHEVTARRLIDRGEIPAAKIGRNIRIDKKRLDERLQERIKKGNV